MDKNFGLSANEFEQLVQDLKKNETVFFKRVFLMHFKDCMTFLQKNYQATYDDAYDATMDTLIQFRRLLVEGKLHYGNLRYLFTRMATQIYQKSRKNFQLEELQESDLEWTEQPAPVSEENMALLNAVWQELGTSCQELLKLFYYGKMKLKEIAELNNKTPAAVRKQKERCIEGIKAFFKKKQVPIQ